MNTHICFKIRLGVATIKEEKTKNKTHRRRNKLGRSLTSVKETTTATTEAAKAMFDPRLNASLNPFVHSLKKDTPSANQHVVLSTGDFSTDLVLF